jgi:hypothetical protein
MAMKTIPQAGPDAAASAMRLLEHLAEGRKLVMAEIEGTALRFRVRLALKDGRVIGTKPLGLKGVLNEGTTVRIRPLDEGDKEIRLTVLVPHADLGGGNAVFVCAAPVGLLSNLRHADRFSVAHNPSLLLEVRGQAFRLADLSSTGCRIALTASQAPQMLPVGNVVPNANLMLGPSIWVRVTQFLPRVHQGRAIGCEFKPGKDEMSMQNLRALIDSLKQLPLAAAMAADGPRRAIARPGTAGH